MAAFTFRNVMLHILCMCVCVFVTFPSHDLVTTKATKKLSEFRSKYYARLFRQESEDKIRLNFIYTMTTEIFAIFGFLSCATSLV
jgi:hypothetical protein